MNSKMIYALIVSALLGLFSTITLAEDSKATDDENTVIGACLSQKVMDKYPDMKEADLEKCSNGDANDLPKCLRLTDEEFMSIMSLCRSQLANAKCVSAKMKVSLLDYADCGYEKDPEACYKGLGFTLADIIKISENCTASGAK
jgi:hypothetical protein